MGDFNTKVRLGAEDNVVGIVGRENIEKQMNETLVEKRQ